MSDSQFDDIDTTAMSAQERRIRKQVRRQADFYKHFMSYLGVNTFLWIICIWTLGFGRPLWQYWAIWPTLGWGIGLFFHALGTLPYFHRWGTDWEERKVQEILSREKSRG